MICIGFYFLMHPGKHTTPSSDSKPFRLIDVEFMIGQHWYNGHKTPLNMLPMVIFAILVFSDQKNGVCGKKIGHRQSGHSCFCTVKALSHHVLRHPQEHNAPGDTPLCTYYINALA
jgi:hypothetical protein